MLEQTTPQIEPPNKPRITEFTSALSGRAARWFGGLGTCSVQNTETTIGLPPSNLVGSGESHEAIIAPELIGAWMQRVDQAGILDKAVEINKGDDLLEGESGRETVILRDAVYPERRTIRQRQATVNTQPASSPLVVLERADGTCYELSVGDFLLQSDFDTEAFRETLEAEDVAKRTMAAGRLAEANAAEAAKKVAREAIQKRRNEALLAPIAYPNNSYVTDESRQAAAKCLSQATKVDENLAALIQSYGTHLASQDPLAVIDLLRTNPVCRLEVGTYLLSKVDQLARDQPHRLPDRIVDNREKSPPDVELKTVPNMSSREYVTMLALAKLDGSFNYRSHPEDAIKYDSKGVALEGQHRAAAEMLLAAENFNT